MLKLLICARMTMIAGGYKEAGDPEHPKKQHFLSFMVMELLGPSVGHLSLELQTYTSNTNLLVNHGLGMLKVSTQGSRWVDSHVSGWP
jgi:hypothetical protein